MAKFEKQLFNKLKQFWHDTSSCTCSIYLYCIYNSFRWYKLTSPCMHYLSKSKTSKQEKMAKFTKLSFCQKLIFWHKTSSCKCSMCLYYVGKVSDTKIASVKALVQVDFPMHALSEH